MSLLGNSSFAWGDADRKKFWRLAPGGALVAEVSPREEQQHGYRHSDRNCARGHV
jgi:hypothetical protein